MPMLMLVLLIMCVSIMSCINFDRASNTTNHYEYNLPFEQACILKNHYQEVNKDIPSSVQAVITESEMDCN